MLRICRKRRPAALSRVFGLPVASPFAYHMYLRPDFPYQAMPRPHFQESLFDSSSEQSSLSIIAAVSRAKPQDKQQATFQRLIRQIEEHRAQVAEWHAYQERYNRRVTGEMMPTYARIREQRLAMARLLDVQYHQRDTIRGKRLRRKLREMILGLARDLLAEAHDAEIEALHDKHSDLSHAEHAELDKALSQDMIENIFGVRLDEADESASMDEMIAKAAQKLHQQAEQQAAQRQSRRESAKATAAEEKRAATKEVSQSVREVYRKLASALHPDRPTAELNADRKTALMQRVNSAYDSGNLLELLNIQLEIEQIDASYLANLSAERTRHYNQVLREQLDELKAELQMLMAPYRQLVPFTPKLKTIHVEMAMDSEIARLKNDLQQLENDLLDFQDPKRLSVAIKDYEFDDGLDELEALGALLDVFGAPEPPRKRRRKR